MILPRQLLASGDLLADLGGNFGVEEVTHFLSEGCLFGGKADIHQFDPGLISMSPAAPRPPATHMETTA